MIKVNDKEMAWVEQEFGIDTGEKVDDEPFVLDFDAVEDALEYRILMGGTLVRRTIYVGPWVEVEKDAAL